VICEGSEGVKMPMTAREFDEPAGANDIEDSIEDAAEESVNGGGQHQHPEVELVEDEVDDASRRVRVGVSTYATQTELEEGDVVDGSILVQSHSLYHNNNHSFDIASGSGDSAGFLSNLFTMVLPVKKKPEDLADGAHAATNRNIATQTEEQDPICARGQQLSLLLIQELSLQKSISGSYKDDVYESLASCICDMLLKHSILFNGMVRRCHVSHYHIFTCIANEIFEVNEQNHLTVTWGRIISLFAFAVRLAQEYRQDQEQVESIVRFLATYVTKHLIPFIRSQGGWETLVQHYPVPVGEDTQVKRAILWSGLCVGLMATMYVSSFLSSR